jgi:hypothetical protein
VRRSGVPVISVAGDIDEGAPRGVADSVIALTDVCRVGETHLTYAVALLIRLGGPIGRDIHGLAGDYFARRLFI